MRHLEGHSAPPSKVRFYDPVGTWLISTGLDHQIRLTSIENLKSKNMSQRVSAKAKKLGVSIRDLMLPPVLDFDTCKINICTTTLMNRLS